MRNTTETDYKKQNNRCPKCGHRMNMQDDLGFCTVETKSGKCECKSHFWTAKLIKD